MAACTICSANNILPSPINGYSSSTSTCVLCRRSPEKPLMWRVTGVNCYTLVSTLVLRTHRNIFSIVDLIPIVNNNHVLSYNKQTRVVVPFVPRSIINSLVYPSRVCVHRVFIIHSDSGWCLLLGIISTRQHIIPHPIFIKGCQNVSLKTIFQPASQFHSSSLYAFGIFCFTGAKTSALRTHPSLPRLPPRHLEVLWNWST